MILRKEACPIISLLSEPGLSSFTKQRESHSDLTQRNKCMHIPDFSVSSLDKRVEQLFGFYLILVMTEKRIQKVHCKFVQNVCIYKYIIYGCI